jgi:hypothetical protein
MPCRAAAGTVAGGAIGREALDAGMGASGASIKPGEPGEALSPLPAFSDCGVWYIEAYYHERAATPGKMNTRWGGFLDNVDRFDAELFGIAPHEAIEIHPQQRLLLETAWRAFEHSGQPLDQLAGSNTGVYVGISTNDYLQLQIKLRPGMDQYNAYTGLARPVEDRSAKRIRLLFQPSRRAEATRKRHPAIMLMTALNSLSVIKLRFCSSANSANPIQRKIWRHAAFGSQWTRGNCV